MEALFGTQIQTKDGTVPVAEAIGDAEVVALYFSAHWCPPCRGFTPKLAAIYKTMREAGKKFEVVFVSSDRDEKSFNEYFAEMPWKALPYSDRDRKAALSKQYKVSGIPTLVLVNGAGELITKDGRGAVTDDPVANFPFTPKTFHEALGTQFVRPDGSTVDFAEMKGKTLGIYFSAHWCPPCRGFTPQLVETYKKVTGDGKPFEVIFSSGDRDEASFKEYHGEMPWPAIPYAEKGTRGKELDKLFEVSGIPTLVIVDADTGKVVNADGRAAVSADGDGKEFPWVPKPVNELEAGAGDLNEETCVIVMMEGVDDGYGEDIVKDLSAVAAKAAAAAGDAPMKYRYFWAKSGGGITSQVRKLTKVGAPADEPVLMILDIPDNGGFYVCDAKVVDEESIGAFVAAYEAKSLSRQQLG